MHDLVKRAWVERAVITVLWTTVRRAGPLRSCCAACRTDASRQQSGESHRALAFEVGRCGTVSGWIPTMGFSAVVT